MRARPSPAETAEPAAVPPGVLIDDPQFTVEARTLDHGIPCLGFALRERTRVNVHRSALDRRGLPTGPWLTKAKQAIRAGAPGDTRFDADGTPVTLDELLDEGIIRLGRGQHIAYVTDFGATAGNIARVLELADGADHLFIESTFLDEIREEAAHRFHLTAAQAGDIARQAGARRATPFHFSGRLATREQDLRDEFARHYRAEAASAL